MKVGFEGEYFLRNAAEELIEVPTGLPRDECGYLAECRGPASTDPLDAAYLYLAAEEKLRRQFARSPGQPFLDGTLNTIKLDPAFKRDLARRFGKEPYPTTRFNLYGKDFPVKDPWDRAGMHVHFSNEKEVRGVACKECGQTKVLATIPGMVNIPFIVGLLDKTFVKEIKEAKRMLGWYELKPHGFEYRSLPAHFDGGVVRVATVLQEHWSKVSG